VPAENFLGEMRCLPAQAAADLVNHLATRGHALQAGDFISTGAASVPQPFTAGDHVRADFGTLGVIELAF
jgi:2-keto-4-pentenoate hydratase